MNLSFLRTFVLFGATLLFSSSFSILQGQKEIRESFEKALAEAVKELEQERRERDAARETMRGTLEELREERERLESLLKDAESRLIALESREKEISQEKVRVEAEAALLEEDSRKVGDSIRHFGAFVAGWVKSSPFHPQREERIAECRSLESSWEKGEGWEELFSIMESEAKLAKEVSFFPGEVTTGQGEKRRASFIQFGRIGGAFRSDDGTALGAALLRQPTKDGLRWHEDIGWLSRQRLNSLFHALQKREEGVYHIPLDVAQGFRFSPSLRREDLFETLASGGVVMIPLLLIAAAAVTLIVERFLFIRREKKEDPEKLTKEVIAHCRNNEHARALELCARSRGPMGRVLERTLRAGSPRRKEMEDSLQEAMLRELPRLERFLTAISILAAVSPLLGLLGTVSGMISTFRTITLYGTGDPRLLSGGISEALITTQVGLIIAIPLLLFHGFLAGGVDQITSGMEKGAVSFINGIFMNREGKEDPGEKSAGGRTQGGGQP